MPQKEEEEAEMFIRRNKINCILLIFPRSPIRIDGENALAGPVRRRSSAMS